MAWQYNPFTGTLDFYSGTTASANGSYLFDDFGGDVSGSSTGACGDTGFTPIKGSGTGTVISTLAGSASATNPGVLTVNAGTAATNNFGIVRRGLSAFILGGGGLVFEGRLRLPTLSISTEEYDVRFGIASTNGNADFTNGVYFMYSRNATFTCTGTTQNGSLNVTGLTSFSGVIDATSIQGTQAITGTGIAGATTVASVNPGAGTLVLSQNATASGTVTLTFTVGNFWMCRTATASTRSIQVTSTAVVAAVFPRLMASVNAAGTSATFSINGTTVATIASNIPAIAVFPTYAINKTASAGASSLLDIDSWEHTLSLTASR